MTHQNGRYTFLNAELSMISESCNLFSKRTAVSISHHFMMVNRGSPGLLARVLMFKLFRPGLQIVDRIDPRDLALDGVRVSTQQTTVLDPTGFIFCSLERILRRVPRPPSVTGSAVPLSMPPSRSLARDR